MLLVYINAAMTYISKITNCLAGLIYHYLIHPNHLSKSSPKTHLQIYSILLRRHCTAKRRVCYARWAILELNIKIIYKNT